MAGPFLLQLSEEISVVLGLVSMFYEILYIKKNQMMLQMELFYNREKGRTINSLRSRKSLVRGDFC